MDIKKKILDLPINTNSHNLHMSVKDYIINGIDYAIDSSKIYLEAMDKNNKLVDDFIINIILRSIDLNDCIDCGYPLKLYFDGVIDVVTSRHMGLCSYDPSPKTEVELEFKSGELKFMNFIKGIATDAPLGDSGLHEYDLNSQKGQTNITIHNASLNVGYCQTGNMILEVYTNKDNSEIFIYDYSAINNECESCDETNDEYCENECGYKPKSIDISKLTHIGEISCDVWRWMCYDMVDHDMLKEYTVNATKNKNKYHKVTEKDFEVEGSSDFIYTVKKGKWLLVNYKNWDDTGLLSKLTYKGELK